MALSTIEPQSSQCAILGFANNKCFPKASYPFSMSTRFLNKWKNVTLNKIQTLFLDIQIPSLKQQRSWAFVSHLRLCWPEINLCAVPLLKLEHYSHVALASLPPTLSRASSVLDLASPWLLLLARCPPTRKH